MPVLCCSHPPHAPTIQVTPDSAERDHKGIEFGRQFQIGRVGGNFVYSIPNDPIRMPNAASLKKMVVQYIELFQIPIESIGTDKGYYSKDAVY